MNNQKTLTNLLVTKLILSFLFLVLLIGASFTFVTIYFTNNYFEETSQKLHSNIAEHIIEEKFANASPYLEDGSVNKEFFGDLMHDMMAVNRSIEVYLLDNDGSVLYSVVLNHDNPNDPSPKVDLGPVNSFIANGGAIHILGDDPKDPEHKKIFSAAKFEHKGHSGYIYVILASQAYQNVTASLFSSYSIKLGIGASILIMVFALLIGFISVWFLTKNLREIITVVRRFREGDLEIRVENANKSDLSILANSFNEMADTIVSNMDKIKSVDNLRRELIANVSHDLRTPLSIMKGYVETLQMKKESLSEKEKENYLDIIQDSSDKLSKMISQLFEYSKLEARQIEPNKEPFSITDLALDLISKYKVISDKKEIEIKLEAGKKLPLVFADISLVERAIQNLMDNALKYTPEKGKITLKITPSDKFVQVIVSDTGLGIKESDQSIIFERYRQTDAKERESAGLGLAIVKKIMELHNTTIKVVSQPDRGSSFEFLLPSYAG
jgi:signal transduction histidine kinase